MTHKLSNFKNTTSVPQTLDDNARFQHHHCNASSPPRFPSVNALPGAFHLPKRASLDRSIVTIQHPLLTLIRLTKGIAPLFPHPLHLPNFTDGFLELLHPRSVVLDVVFLYLLDMVVCLWFVHSLGVLPGEVAEEAEDGQNDHHEVEDWRGKDLRYDTFVFGRDADLGGHNAVYGKEDQPNSHTAGYRDERVLRPDIGHESCFPKDRGEDGAVDHGAPDPVTSHFAIALDEIIEPDQLEKNVGDQRVVEAIENPREK